MNSAFRSHLMQQFASSARNQVRTPIALIGWVDQQDDNMSSSMSQYSYQTTRALNSVGTSTDTSGIAGHQSIDMVLSDQRKVQKRKELTKFSTTSLRPALESKECSPLEEHGVTGSMSAENIASALQRVMASRRTTSKFMRLPAFDYKMALERAVEAGRAAPNHKRTEPFTFKRMISPSSATEVLADIAANVYIHEKRGVLSDQLIQTQAEQKREKWKNIPAFLVALVKQQKQTKIQQTEESVYIPLPFHPPQSTLELEDYAAACAATQNILLSLHSSDLGAKWATGSVIQTPAFRDLVQLDETDRVVGLIMIGHAMTPATARRHRRALLGDVLQDL